MAKDLGIAILAAGKGTRLRSQRAKVLFEIGGATLLEHVIRVARTLADTSDIYVIIRHQADTVRKQTAHTGVQYVLQAEQRGTGHAIQCARKQLSQYKEILVLSGDAPLVRPETLRAMLEQQRKQRAAMTILTAIADDPAEYGRILRAAKSGPAVKAIVEKKTLTKAQHKLREINSGIYCFTTHPLFAHIDRLTTANAHGEFYLTDIAALLVKAKSKVIAFPASDIQEIQGANTLEEVAALDRTIRRYKCRDLMASGVTIYRPETCTIDTTVEIEPDAILEPFVQLLGNTKISTGSLIRSYSVIENSIIGPDVTVRNGCILDDAIVSRGAILGPYAHLRPGSVIGEDAHVGNFVETKKVRLGKGSKANHLTYLGDAEIGAGVNVGAGTITCNYDGVNKHLTTIKDGVFVGSDSTLVAPVTIGEGAYIGAGSCITDDVPGHALALGRSRQVVKPDWVKQKKSK